MKEAISNAFLFNIVIVFVVVLIALFVGSLSYTKAYKVKNKIVEEIEKEGEVAGSQFVTKEQAATAYENAEGEIIEWLKSGDEGKGIGYRMNTTGTVSCNYDKGKLVSGKQNAFEYCVYQINTCEENSKSDRCGIYYHVITYMYVDLPLIDQIFKIPVHGETKTFETLDS